MGCLEREQKSKKLNFIKNWFINLNIKNSENNFISQKIDLQFSCI